MSRRACTAVSDTAVLTLGLDLGTSAVKAAVLDTAGSVLAFGTASFATVSVEPGQAEQDPAAWLAAAAAALGALDAGMGARLRGWRDHIAAVGLAGQLPTLVCGAGDAPLGPAITWQDARADDWASKAIDSSERRRLYERTGMPIDGRYLGPMFRYHWAKRAREVEYVLSAKDYLGYALTGQRVTDPSTAVGYAAFELATGAFSDELCERWQMPPRMLPTVISSHTAAGALTGAGARLLGLGGGIPVTAGAADSVAGAYAMAGLATGTVCIITGSSTIVIDAIREPRLDVALRYLLTPHVEPGGYGREMDLLATGTGYAWLNALFGFASGEFDARAASCPPGARGLTFRPYLAGGEQGALWDPTLRASIRGLSLTHTAADIARAFLEGMTFEIRRCLDVLAETADIERVVVCGHLVERPSSLQMLADVLERPVQLRRMASTAAVGAALGARPLAGLAVAAEGLRVDAAPDSLHPGADRGIYQRLYADYRAKTPS